MLQAQASIFIDSPIETVFAFVADQHNAAKWQTNILAVHRLTQDIIGVGTQHIALRSFFDAEVEVFNEVVKFELNREIRFIERSSSTEFETSYLFEPIGEATRVTNLTNVKTVDWTLLSDAEMIAALEGDFSANFEALKALLESQPPPSIPNYSAKLV